MKRFMFGVCSSTLFLMVKLNGLEAQIDEDVLNKCTKEELLTFFPPQVVESVLKKAQMPPEQSAAIAKELSQKDRELTKIVEDKASKLEADPFQDLSQRDLGIQIYRETLYEVFAKVLKKHGVENEDQIQTLLENMRKAKSTLFIECIRRQTTPPQPTTPEKDESSAPLTKTPTSPAQSSP